MTVERVWGFYYNVVALAVVPSIGVGLWIALIVFASLASTRALVVSDAAGLSADRVVKRTALFVLLAPIIGLALGFAFLYVPAFLGGEAAQQVLFPGEDFGILVLILLATSIATFWAATALVGMVLQRVRVRALARDKEPVAQSTKRWALWSRISAFVWVTALAAPALFRIFGMLLGLSRLGR